MKVTKAQIIKALRTQPLAVGTGFFVRSDGKCCAVGAVARSIDPSISNEDTYLTMFFGPFIGLSRFFEQGPRRVTTAFREKLVAFVRKEFPATINIKGLKAPRKSKAQVSA